MSQELTKVRWGFDDIVASLLLALLTLLSVVNVFMRYVVERPFEWAGEVTILLFVWGIMFGAASVMKREGHIGIDVFVTLLPEKGQRLVRIVTHIIVAVVLIVMVYLGFKLTLNGLHEIMPITHISYAFLNASVPVGSLFIVFHVIRNLLREF
ncbi:MAG: TRAP transporter small permease [Desulfitobacterium hafniense]|nr:TRAP transporter small permease [Desulfitobacterium hafniense]